MVAYRDPYDLQNNVHEHNFNPYSSQQPYQTYEQGEIDPTYDNYGSRYTDEPRAPSPQRGPSQRSPGGKEGIVSPDGFTPAGGERTARALRNYRYDHQGKLWTKGGRGRCIGRFCCCTIMIAILLFVSIVLALILWVRPPSVSIGQVGTVIQNGSAIQLQQNGLTVNLGVNISVNNPNYFSIDFQQIKADIFYPINNTNVGQGLLNHVVIHSKAQTNLTFPFTINYQTYLDPQYQILQDLAQKCGVVGTKSNISVQYKITLKLLILFIPISPVVSNSFNFPCPISASDLAALIKSVGINVNGL